MPILYSRLPFISHFECFVRKKKFETILFPRIAMLKVSFKLTRTTSLYKYEEVICKMHTHLKSSLKDKNKRIN